MECQQPITQGRGGAEEKEQEDYGEAAFKNSVG